jgi:hypothetical protein
MDAFPVRRVGIAAFVQEYKHRLELIVPDGDVKGG